MFGGNNRMNHYEENKDRIKCAKCNRSIKNLAKGRKYCNRCKNTRRSHGKYKCRIIVKGIGKKAVYGITIPEDILKKYKLKDKIFSVGVSEEGKFILYTRKD